MSMLMIERLRNLNIDQPDIDALIELSSGARALITEFSANSIDAPEWLTQKQLEIKKEITARRKDYIAKSLKEAKARLEALNPAEERRAELSEKIKNLETMLSQ